MDINGIKTQVCRGCLLSVLDESDNFIKTLGIKKQASFSGIISSDGRGKAENSKKHSEEKILNVRNHLRSFPAYESHYARKANDHKFLPTHLTIDKMYKMYKESVPDPVSISIYAREFHVLKLKFKKPYVDTCHTCDSFAMRLKVTTNAEQRKEIEKERDAHHKAQEQAYSEKRKDTKISRNSVNNNTGIIKCLTFDLEQCLPTPALETSTMFYKRQLWVYNLTVHDNGTDNVTCYMWHEAIAGRGANQIASCLFKHLKSLPEEVSHVVFYSDTCGGQNKNSHVAAMFTAALQQLPHIQTIDHKFMVPGHTYIEADMDHSVIERKKKKSDIPIYHPHDWYQLVRSCGHRFKVEEMNCDDFLDFAGLLKGPLVSRKHDSNKEKFLWHDACWLRYTSMFGTIQFKTTLSEDDSFKTLDLLRRNKTGNDIILRKITTDPVPISEEKKKDLVSILHLIPEVFRPFYQNLTTSSTAPNVDPDLVEMCEEDM